MRHLLTATFALLTSFAIAASALAAQAQTSIRVALYDAAGSFGKGVPCVCTEIGKCTDLAVTKVKPDEIRAGILTNFDVVAFTGGSAGGQSKALGAEGRAKVRAFVENGGGYLGICAGAYLACSTDDSDLGLIAAQTVSPKWQRGEGTVRIELKKSGQKLFGVKEKIFDIHYQNGPIIQRTKVSSLPPYQILAIFHTELAENGTPKGIMIDAPAIATSTCGKGRVMVISPHPEQTPGMEHFVSGAVKWLGTGK